MLRILASVVCFALLATGCGGSESTPPSAPQDVIYARDAALHYVEAWYLVGLNPTATWHEDQVESGDLVDWVEYQYSNVPWLVTVGGPAGGPDAGHYDVVVMNPSLGFSWEGRVDTNGFVAEGPEQVFAACDSACDFVSAQFPEFGLDDLGWTGRRVTPTGLVGQETFAYTAEDWKLTVSYPVVAPDAVVYDITLENDTTGFVWEGEMDSARHLSQTNAYSRAPEADSA